MPSALASPRLRRILIAYTVNRLGTWFGLVALLIAVFDRTHSAIAIAGLLFAGQALPAFVVPAVVARVEASSRRGELSALYVFEGLVTAGLAALLMWRLWLPGVLVLAALDGTAALAASALLRAELARAAREQADEASEEEHASEERAQEAERGANAALNLVFSATFVTGPALAGVVVASAGAPTALIIDAGSFLLCGALLIDLHPHVADAADSVGGRLRAAWEHVNEMPTLRRLLLVDALALVFFESASPIEVIYAKGTLHAGDRGFGLLMTSWGAGAVLGSVLFARALRRPLGVMLSAGAFAIGVAYAGYAAAPSLLLACLAAFVGGVGNGVELPSLISLVQRLTPPPLQGQLMGAVESLNSLCVVVGLPLGGALVVLSSTRTAFVVVGAGTMLTALALLRISRSAPSTSAAELPGARIVGAAAELQELAE